MTKTPETKQFEQIGCVGRFRGADISPEILVWSKIQKTKDQKSKVRKYWSSHTYVVVN